MPNESELLNNASQRVNLIANQSFRGKLCNGSEIRHYALLCGLSNTINTKRCSEGELSFKNSIFLGAQQSWSEQTINVSWLASEQTNWLFDELGNPAVLYLLIEGNPL